MQTRKRAKSAIFGKKPKEDKTKEKVEEKVASVSSEKVAKKTEVVERRTVPDKPVSDELSSTLPKVEAEAEEQEEPKEPEAPVADVATPASEFITDTPLSGTPETQKPAAEEPPNIGTNPIIASPSLTGETPQPLESLAQPPTAPVDQTATPATPAPAASQELSPTPPQSAFTIQAGEAEAETPVKTGGGKRRFFVYFFVVALLSFILGLGAMAGASYFGFFKGANLPKLPGAVQMPHIGGSNPTPTPPPPPPATPTPKSVNLTTFTIAILNGSGISGKAADEKSTLTTAGFKITSTGNADNNNFTKTEISAKKSVDQAFLSKLQDELKKSYNVDTTVAVSPDSDQTDVTITLGSQTGQ